MQANLPLSYRKTFGTGLQTPFHLYPIGNSGNKEFFKYKFSL